jgi:pimeloyl-ACP methyl ester carboxylesterase
MKIIFSYLKYCVVAAVIAFIFISMNTAADEAQESFQIPEISTPRIEKMLEVGGRNLHCCVYGKGSPTVVLLSGFGAPQTYWNPVVPDLAAQTTVLTYDRAGIGKSEIGSLPAHGKRAVIDLHMILDKLELPKPYIVIGHSYGGDLARLFVSMFPDDIGGLILEDSTPENILEEQRKILKGEDLEKLEAMVSRFASPEDPRTEGDYREITSEQVKNSGPLPQVPFIVISAGDRSKGMPPIFSEEGSKSIIELGMKLQKEMATLIQGGKHIIVDGAGHNIHLEKPEALIKPALAMIEEVQKK